MKLEQKAPVIMVYNKCDKIHILPKTAENTICISASQNKGIDELKEMHF